MEPSKENRQMTTLEESGEPVTGRQYRAPVTPAHDDQIPFRWETRIRLIDVDLTGRIHNTSLLRYFEATEMEFFRALGLNLVAEMANSGFPRVRVECEFLSALRFDDLVKFELRIGKLGHASVRLDYVALKDGKAAARGKVTLVCMNPVTERPKAFPETVAKRLEQFGSQSGARFSNFNADPQISSSGYLA